jgi:hypothetical protein
VVIMGLLQYIIVYYGYKRPLVSREIENAGAVFWKFLYITHVPNGKCEGIMAWNKHVCFQFHMYSEFYIKIVIFGSHTFPVLRHW